MPAPAAARSCACRVHCETVPVGTVPPCRATHGSNLPCWWVGEQKALPVPAQVVIGVPGSGPLLTSPWASAQSPPEGEGLPSLMVFSGQTPICQQGKEGQECTQ